LDFCPIFPGFQDLSNFLLKSINIGSKFENFSLPWQKTEKSENFFLSGNSNLLKFANCKRQSKISEFVKFYWFFLKCPVFCQVLGVKLPGFARFLTIFARFWSEGPGNPACRASATPFLFQFNA
jgi:hypothetical protein